VPAERLTKVTGPVGLARGAGVGHIEAAQHPLVPIDPGQDRLLDPLDRALLLLDGDEFLLRPHRLGQSGMTPLVDPLDDRVVQADPLVELLRAPPGLLVQVELGVLQGHLPATDGLGRLEVR
jgi:hypothetical protein